MAEHFSSLKGRVAPSINPFCALSCGSSSGNALWYSLLPRGLTFSSAADGAALAFESASALSASLSSWRCCSAVLAARLAARAAKSAAKGCRPSSLISPWRLISAREYMPAQASLLHKTLLGTALLVDSSSHSASLFIDTTGVRSLPPQLS